MIQTDLEWSKVLQKYLEIFLSSVRFFLGGMKLHICMISKGTTITSAKIGLNCFLKTFFDQTF